MEKAANALPVCVSARKRSENLGKHLKGPLRRIRAERLYMRLDRETGGKGVHVSIAFKGFHKVFFWGC